MTCLIKAKMTSAGFISKIKKKSFVSTVKMSHILLINAVGKSRVTCIR